MKFIHLSDLHLGKRINEYSMLEYIRNTLPSHEYLKPLTIEQYNAGMVYKYVTLPYAKL